MGFFTEVVNEWVDNVANRALRRSIEQLKRVSIGLTLFSISGFLWKTGALAALASLFLYFSEIPFYAAAAGWTTLINFLVALALTIISLVLIRSKNG
jgi:hypothetical protein